jgi:hypothetical protein
VSTVSNDSVEKILEARKNVHGVFSVGAAFTQPTKKLFEAMPSWERMPADQRESIHMIIHKMQRIGAGDNNHIDHWEDIAGYAMLIVKALRGASWTPPETYPDRAILTGVTGPAHPAVTASLIREDR